MKRNLLLCIICTLLIILWGYAVLSKLAGFTAFGDQLQKQPLPVWSIPILKWGLPIIELSVTVFIYSQRTRLIGLIMSLTLMVAFTIYVAVALSGTFGKIPCSCAGVISALQWRGHLLFNIVFTAISITGVYLELHKDNRFVKHKAVSV